MRRDSSLDYIRFGRVAVLIGIAAVVMGCGRHRHKPPKAPKAPKARYAAPAENPSYDYDDDQPVSMGGSCQGSCDHYLACKGNQSPNAYATCIQRCQAMGLNSQQLATYMGTDCATAIYQAEAGYGGSRGPSATPAGLDCNGCAWDGSSCIWLSQSNWGVGAYSGAYSSCDSRCCPGH